MRLCFGPVHDERVSLALAKKESQALPPADYVDSSIDLIVRAACSVALCHPITQSIAGDDGRGLTVGAGQLMLPHQAKRTERPFTARLPALQSPATAS